MICFTTGLANGKLSSGSAAIYVEDNTTLHINPKTVIKGEVVRLKKEESTSSQNKQTIYVVEGTIFYASDDNDHLDVVEVTGDAKQNIAPIETKETIASPKVHPQKPDTSPQKIKFNTIPLDSNTPFSFVGSIRFVYGVTRTNRTLEKQVVKGTNDYRADSFSVATKLTKTYCRRISLQDCQAYDAYIFSLPPPFTLA